MTYRTHDCNSLRPSDAGKPVVVSEPASTAAEAYRDIASNAWAELERRRGEAREAPRIVMES